MRWRRSRKFSSGKLTALVLLVIGVMALVSFAGTAAAGWVSIPFLSASQGVCQTPSSSAGGSSLECNLGTIPAGGSAVITMGYTPAGQGTVCNTATANASEKEHNIQNNSATACTTVKGAADLEITKEIIGGVSVPKPGSCPSTCSQGSYPTVASQPVNTCGQPYPTNSCGQPTLGTCGQSNTCGSYPMVGAPTVVPVSAPQPSAGGQAVATLGKPITYRLKVVNHGPSAATGVTVQDSLPFSLNLLSASPSQGSCAQTGNTLSCALGSLGVGGVATIDVAAKPNDVGVVTNCAAVSGNESDPVSANNSDCVTTRVTEPLIDLAVTKTGEPNPVQIGGVITYTVIVTNHGPDAATGVILRDVLSTTSIIP